MDMIRSVVEDRFWRIEAPAPGIPGEWFRYNAAYKGSLKRRTPLRRVQERTRFFLDDQLGGFEWHSPETTERWTSSRWSGPSRVSNLEFSVERNTALSISIHILGHFQRDLATDVQVLANGVKLDATFEPTADRTTLISVTVPAAELEGDLDHQADPLRLTFHVARTQRPIDVGINDDRRWLGIAVNWVELAPVPEDLAE
jgi:hypothetical protein